MFDSKIRSKIDREDSFLTRGKVATEFLQSQGPIFEIMQKFLTYHKNHIEHFKD
jgi:hypothetical protein